MVDKHRRAVAIDHDLAGPESKQVGYDRVLVERIGLLLTDPAACVLRESLALAQSGGGVAAGSVDGGGADD